MADDRGVTVVLSQFHRIEGLSQRTNLIDFHQDGITDPFVDSALKKFHIGNKQIIAHQLHTIANLVGQQLPCLPVVFGASILNADNRIFTGQFIVVGYQVRTTNLLATALLEHVALGLGIVKL